MKNKKIFLVGLLIIFVLAFFIIFSLFIFKYDLGYGYYRKAGKIYYMNKLLPESGKNFEPLGKEVVRINDYLYFKGSGFSFKGADCTFLGENFLLSNDLMYYFSDKGIVNMRPVLGQDLSLYNNVSWIKFRNGSLNYDFEYPNNWRLEENYYQSIFSQYDKKLVIQLLEKDENINLQDVFALVYMLEGNCVINFLRNFDLEKGNKYLQIEYFTDYLKKSKSSQEECKSLFSKHETGKQILHSPEYKGNLYKAIYLNKEEIQGTIENELLDEYKEFMHIVLSFNQPLFHNNDIGKYYIVREGDTFWSISKKFYGAGIDWGELKIQPLDYNDRKDLNDVDVDPYNLEIGTKIYFDSRNMLLPMENSDSNNIGIDNETGNVFTKTHSYIYKNGELYNGPFYYIKDFRMVNGNVIYLVNVDDQNDESCLNSNKRIFSFGFNNTVNSHSSCGWDFSLFRLSPDNKHYVVRNNFQNARKEDDKYIVLSDLGNGEYFDFLDSIYWLDDQTIVYRAQNNDEWRIVVNHKDLVVHDYLEDLIVVDGVIYYKARENGKMINREIKL